VPDSAPLPVIDVTPLVGQAPEAARAAVASQIQAACRAHGFFYVTGHGVPDGLLDQLAEASAEFFALPLAGKLEIAMERGATVAACRSPLPPGTARAGSTRRPSPAPWSATSVTCSTG